MSRKPRYNVYPIDASKMILIMGEMTQIELAEKIGMTQSSLSRILAAGSARYPTIVRIAKGLGVNPAEITLEHVRDQFIEQTQKPNVPKRGLVAIQPNKLRRYLEQDKKNQKWLAAETGLSQTTISKAWNGRPIHINSAQKIADALNIFVWQLIEE